MWSTWLSIYANDDAKEASNFWQWSTLDAKWDDSRMFGNIVL